MSLSSIQKIRGDADAAAFARVASWAFGFPEADAPAWFEKAGLDNIRVMRDGERVAAGLIVIPMGQFFGGRSVPMVGIAGVAVSPEDRGRGAALALMRETLRELQAQGTALSTLYPATLTLYRKAGYALCGSHFEISAPAKELPLGERTGSVRPIVDADALGIEELYRRHTAPRDGRIDRGRYVWSRVRDPRKGRARGFVLERDGSIEGWVYAVQVHPSGCREARRAEHERFDLHLSDVQAFSGWAVERLITLLGDHRSIGDRVVWNGGSADPLLLAIPERVYSVRLKEHWMTRIVSVERALEARGYVGGVKLCLELEVADDLLSENAGRFVLEVEDGRGRVRRGGSGELSLDVRELAQLYSGFLTPQELSSAGSALGSAAALDRARVVFSGSEPEMPDFF